MNPRTKLLRELVRDGHYVVDPHAVAEAILVRRDARRVLPDLTLRSAPKPEQVRSFRPHRGARSFRLCRGERRPAHRAAPMQDLAGAF